jgi:hypothetical protein
MCPVWAALYAIDEILKSSAALPANALHQFSRGVQVYPAAAVLWPKEVFG